MTYNFYKALGYPIPKDKELFLYKPHSKKSQEKKLNAITSCDIFSREKKNFYMNEYIAIIEKYGRLYRNIPGVRAIYLCNSITFNALHNESDIDLFIITKQGQLWRARFWSVLLFGLFRIKRNKSNSKRKFCLSFYVSEDNLNLEHLRLKGGDVYLPYRITHLSELYTEEENVQNKIRNNNQRIKHFLPNSCSKQTIRLGHKKFTGKGVWKKIITAITPNFFISLAEKTIKTIWKPIIKKKSQKNKKNIKHIIANKTMLKFHKDKRRQYHFLFKKSMEN